jgi:hypothetical protein
MDHGYRCPVTDCAMRSRFVVEPSPIFGLFPGVVQIEEPVLPEAFEPDAGVEAFRERVIGRLACFSSSKTILQGGPLQWGQVTKLDTCRLYAYLPHSIELLV